MSVRACVCVSACLRVRAAARASALGVFEHLFLWQPDCVWAVKDSFSHCTAAWRPSCVLSGAHFIFEILVESGLLKVAAEGHKTISLFVRPCHNNSQFNIKKKSIKLISTRNLLRSEVLFFFSHMHSEHCDLTALIFQRMWAYRRDRIPVDTISAASCSAKYWIMRGTETLTPPQSEYKWPCTYTDFPPAFSLSPDGCVARFRLDQQVRLKSQKEGSKWIH